MNKYFAEAVGTFVFVLFSCGCVCILSGFVNTVLIMSISSGLAFALIYLIISKYSGCHLNPSISFAMCLKKYISKSECVKYIIAQVLGAIASCIVLGLILMLISHNTLNNLFNVVNGFGDFSKIGSTMGCAYIVELVATTFFVCIFIIITTSKQYSKFAGVILGCCIVVLYLFLGPFTGGSINPAKSFAMGTVFASFLSSPYAFLYSFLFVVIGFFAAFFGVFLSNYYEEKVTKCVAQAKTEKKPEVKKETVKKEEKSKNKKEQLIEFKERIDF